MIKQENIILCILDMSNAFVTIHRDIIISNQLINTFRETLTIGNIKRACIITFILLITRNKENWVHMFNSLSRPEKIWINFWPPPKMWFIYAKK